VGPRAGLDELKKEKFVFPAKNQTKILRSSSPQPSDYLSIINSN